jgi:hypothetical protein
MERALSKFKTVSKTSPHPDESQSNRRRTQGKTTPATGRAE